MREAEILAADIGGTNSRFAHFSLRENRISLVETQWLKTSGASSFEGLAGLLADTEFALKPEDADIAVYAVAGPVMDGAYANPPAIPWDMDISGGCPGGGRHCGMINDFVAQAYACRSPLAEEAEVVIAGTPEPGAAVAVLGAGTGMGKAALVPDARGGYVAMPSEGGHVAFAFMGGREDEYRRFLLKETGFAYMTPNKVVSGAGLSLLHRFLTGEELSPREVVERLEPGSETLEWAARFYARVARDFALEVLALGGLYIAGGVAARTPEIVMSDAFREEFLVSPELGHLMSSIPVYLQRNQESGLWGAGEYGRILLMRENTDNGG
jgi:glucokinase